LTDDGGNITQTINYLPYGETWVDIQTFNMIDYNLGVYLFNGKEKDSETGYNYFGARYYDDERISWLSVDPLSDKYPNLSPYAYCANNPVNLVDPDGMEMDDPPSSYINAVRGFGAFLENNANSSFLKQLGYSMQEPYNAGRIGSAYGNGISAIASNFQINIANASGLSQGSPGDQGNAIRHTLWEAMLTNELGEDHAKRVGNSHESNTKINLNQRQFGDIEKADNMVDLLNNAIGREIGKKNKGTNNKTLAKKVIDEFYKNGLWTVRDNGNNVFSIEKTKISKEQRDAAIKEIDKKGNNGKNQ
ncbi:MAG: RHS repeat-associated core domain-containing protein, partial [Bacteroidales bacterium]|nr:RHS repeat-associated core domain-containing protein [Bacteroidales bacterium]